MTSASPACPACGSPASGKFCSSCGASLVARTCANCGAGLAPLAKFCHRCGRSAQDAATLAGTPAHHAGLPRRERVAWLVAGLLCVALLAAIVFRVGRPTAPAAPDMANAGAESARESPSQPQGTTGPAAAAPDISQMTPRERFDRLFNRVMQAAEQGDTSQIVRFTPMALGAYAQLDSANADARYHAAVLRLQIGDLPGAVALADTILAGSPGHLFGYIVRGTAAGYRRDTAAERLAGRQFLAGYDAERRSDRIEYREHEPAIEDFKRKVEGLTP